MSAEVVPIKKHRAYARHVKRMAAGCLRDCRAFRPTDVLVIGYDHAGEFFVQSSPPDPAQALWLMEVAKKKLLSP